MGDPNLDRQRGIMGWDSYSTDAPYQDEHKAFSDKWNSPEEQARRENWVGSSPNPYDPDYEPEKYQEHERNNSQGSNPWTEYSNAQKKFNNANPLQGDFQGWAEEHNRVLGLEDPSGVDYGVHRERADWIRNQQESALAQQGLYAQGVGSPLTHQSTAAQDILAQQLSQASAGGGPAAAQAITAGGQAGAGKAIRTADMGAQDRTVQQQQLGAGYSGVRQGDYRQAGLEQAKLEGDYQHQMMKERVAQDWIKLAEQDKAQRAGFEANIQSLYAGVEGFDWANALIPGIANAAASGLGALSNMGGSPNLSTPTGTGGASYNDMMQAAGLAPQNNPAAIQYLAAGENPGNFFGDNTPQEGSGPAFDYPPYSGGQEYSGG